jgi:saccharopine dehydrogenase-like NADP-dependent oxidoreductase
VSVPAVAVLLIGAGALAVAAYRLLARHDDERVTCVRLARAAWREALRQEQRQRWLEARP